MHQKYNCASSYFSAGGRSSSVVNDMMKNQIGGSIWRKTTKTRMNAVQQTSKVVIIVVIVFVAHTEGL